MFDKELFSQKLIYLRESHQLTSPQEAFILGIKRPSLDQLEAGLILPQFTTLNKISNLYGISTDWLLERGTSPYNEDVLFYLESKLLIPDTTQPYCYNLLLNTLLLKCPDNDLSHYQDIKKRQNVYSAAARANIIFALQLLLLFAQTIEDAEKSLKIEPFLIQPQDFLKDEETAWQKWALIFYGMYSKRLANSWLSLYSKCYNLLVQYLVKDKNGHFQVSPQDDIFAPVFLP